MQASRQTASRENAGEVPHHIRQEILGSGTTRKLLPTALVTIQSIGCLNTAPAPLRNVQSDCLMILAKRTHRGSPARASSSPEWPQKQTHGRPCPPCECEMMGCLPGCDDRERLAQPLIDPARTGPAAGPSLTFRRADGQGRQSPATSPGMAAARPLPQVSPQAPCDGPVYASYPWTQRTRPSSQSWPAAQRPSGPPQVELQAFA